MATVEDSFVGVGVGALEGESIAPFRVVLADGEEVDAPRSAVVEFGLGDAVSGTQEMGEGFFYDWLPDCWSYSCLTRFSCLGMPIEGFDMEIGRGLGMEGGGKPWSLHRLKGS